MSWRNKLYPKAERVIGIEDIEKGDLKRLDQLDLSVKNSEY